MNADNADIRATTGAAFGSFDMFHVGHLRALQKASDACDNLVVGVASDELVVEVTGLAPVVPFADRAEVVAGFGLAARVEILDSKDVTVLLQNAEMSPIVQIFATDDSSTPSELLFQAPGLADAASRCQPTFTNLLVETTTSPALADVANEAVLWRVASVASGRGRVS